MCIVIIENVQIPVVRLLNSVFISYANQYIYIYNYIWFDFCFVLIMLLHWILMMIGYQCV